MPFLCEFNTQDVHTPANPQRDTRGTVCFPHPLVARPRLPCGIRALDVDRSANIRAKTTIPYFTHTWADCYISSWYDTTLRSGIASIFALAPADLDFLTGTHARATSDPSSVRVSFGREFVTPPKVVVFFSLLDLGNNHDWHINVCASAVDVSGFTLHIETWGETVLYHATACWIAYPEDRPHIFSMSVNTMDVRPVSQPQVQQSKEITFGADTFWKKPSVFVALNYLDMSRKAPLRINAYVDGVTKTGLVCHIDTWMDSVLYAAGVSIIAFN